MKHSSDIYILGGSHSDFARNWAREGLGLYDMFEHSLQQAVADAAIEPAQIEALAARQDGDRDLADFGGREDELGVRRRLLQRL